MRSGGRSSRSRAGVVGALVAVVPLVLAFMLVQRKFIESIATTGLK